MQTLDFVQHKRHSLFAIWHFVGLGRLLYEEQAQDQECDACEPSSTAHSKLYTYLMIDHQTNQGLVKLALHLPC